jgi:hypothetical protein
VIPCRQSDVCFWHKADIATVLNDVRFLGVKQTSNFQDAMSANKKAASAALVFEE